MTSIKDIRNITNAYIITSAQRHIAIFASIVKVQKKKTPFGYTCYVDSLTLHQNANENIHKCNMLQDWMYANPKNPQN